MSLPLAGWSVVVTRPRGQGGGLVRELEALGARAAEVPLLEVLPPASWRPLDAALRRLSSFDWVLFTSANAARAVLSRLEALGLPAAALGGQAVAAVGPATAGVLKHAGVPPRFVPTRYLTLAIVGGLGELEGRRVLLPRAQAAPPELEVALQARGAEVERVAAYRLRPLPGAGRRLLDHLHGGPTAVTLTSASTVRALVAALEEAGGRERLQELVLACIGPVTARAARELGLEPQVVAREHTVQGLVRALLARTSKLQLGGAAG